MESFFHTLKVELDHQRRRTTRDEARRDLFAYIEGYYNRQRIPSARLHHARTSRAESELPVSAKPGGSGEARRMERAQLRRLQVASAAKAATLLALVGIAVPLEHLAGSADAVRVMRPI